MKMRWYPCYIFNCIWTAQMCKQQKHMNHCCFSFELFCVSDSRSDVTCVALASERLPFAYSSAIDALPPLTEWDSRSLQQKMVGGFSSQSRWIHSCVWADPWLVELRAFAFRSAVSINRCIESCTAQSRLHVCRWFNNLSLCRKKRLGTHPPVKEFHWPHASGDAITQQCRGRRRFPLKL